MTDSNAAGVPVERENDEAFVAAYTTQRALEWVQRIQDGKAPPDTFLQALAAALAVSERAREQAETALAAAGERVAAALYERAMSERRTFSSQPGKFARGWYDEPYVPPFDGVSRSVNWRDGWRKIARTALAAARDATDTTGA